MKYIKISLFAFFACIFFVSCFSDEETVTVYSDVYVLKRIINDATNYAPTHFTYSNVSLESAIAESDEGETITLSSYQGSTYYMAYVPEESDYSAEIPEETGFTYTITTQSGEVVQSYDELTYDNIDFPTITTAEYVDSTDIIELAWTAVSGADGYVLVFYNSVGEALVGGFSLADDETECEIDVSAVSWDITPDSGEECYVEVQAYAYEPSYTDGYQSYNIQEVSIAKKTFLWLQ